jgi:tripartite-type tricarboxylate transporter receptor subunit TctC
MPDHHPLRRAMSVGLVAGATYLGLPNVLAQPSSAATWPDRSVRVVVPYAPGGGADVIARTLFAQVAELLGQTFVIENRGGGAGIIGANAVAKAAPDGYTVLHDATALSVNPALLKAACRLMRGATSAPSSRPACCPTSSAPTSPRLSGASRR